MRRLVPCALILLLVSGCGHAAGWLGLDRAPAREPVYFASAAGGAPPADEAAAQEDYGDLADDDLSFLDEEPEAAPAGEIADPLRPFNRVMFQFNDKLYFHVLKPVAKGYKKAVPEPARTGLRRFFHNLLAPVRFVNCLLQGKVSHAEAEFASFLLNSSVGVGGVMNPAGRHEKMAGKDEDLGQTFGHYGSGPGFYVVWPFLGPSSLRDTLGTVGDGFLSPRNYVQPWWVSPSTTVVEQVNETSFRIGEYESLVDMALDPYTAVKNAWVQNREGKIRD